MWTPSEIIDDKPFDASSFRSVHHGDVRCNASWADNTHRPVVVGEGLTDFFD